MAGRGQAPSRPRNMRHTLQVLLDYMGHARTRLAVVAVLVTVSGLANLLGPWSTPLAPGTSRAFLGWWR